MATPATVELDGCTYQRTKPGTWCWYDDDGQPQIVPADDPIRERLEQKVAS